MNKTTVLIIGAGPTGLMMAAQLSLRNIPFRIIDKNEDHTTQSRALVMHARSLEIFHQMGIDQEAIRRGKQATGLNLLVNGKRAFHINIKNIGGTLTPFPFILMLEQNHTEKILNDFIEKRGHKVERKTELIDFMQGDKNITATLKNENTNELVTCDWIIGADGTHSIVRHKLEIPFKGKTYHQSLFVLDCETDFNYPNDELSIIFTQNGFTGFFPLTNGRYRVIGTIPKHLENKQELQFEDIEKGFGKRIHMNVSLSNPYWISTYHSHHRVVSTFKKGRCFLAGDAAHIHSPIGAQGMNTGLQDAYNLAWKLELVINSKAKEELLDTYHEERKIIAQNLVHTTDRAFNFVSSNEFLTKTFRMYLMPFLLKTFAPWIVSKKAIRKFMFRTVSQIRINYHESSLSKEVLNSFSKHAPKPGERVPYLATTELIVGTEEFTEGLKFHLILFTNKEHKEIIDFTNNYDDLFVLHKIPLRDKYKKLYALFGIKKEGYYLIRPDGYIGFRSSDTKLKDLQLYLDFLHLNKSAC